MVSFDNNNPESTEQVHFVCCKQGSPYQFLIVEGQVSDCGEADFCAERGEEDVLVDEKHINCKLYILMKLDELGWNLDNALQHTLGIFPHCVSLHLQHGPATNHFCCFCIPRETKIRY